MDELVVLDFETTGLSPSYARVIEVGALVIKKEKVVATLSQLLDPGYAIPSFITDITGISTRMVRGQPSPEKFMPKLKKFIGERPIIAHNASFDEKFLISEMENIGEEVSNKFLCTLKLSRRLVPNTPDYKLSSIISHLKIKFPKEHQYHRALNDVISTFHIWTFLKKQVAKNINMDPSFDLLRKLEKQPKNKMAQFFDRYATV